MLKNKFKLFIQGIVVGISNIVPGLSGATLLAYFGIWDKTIDESNNIFKLKSKNKSSSLSFLLFLFTGIGIGIISFSFLYTYVLSEYVPIFVFFLFLLLILMSILGFKKNEINKLNYFYIILGFSILFSIGVTYFILDWIYTIDFINFETNSTFTNFAILFSMGIILIITTLLPGISGSLIMLLFGIYDDILLYISKMFYDLDAFLNILFMFVGIIIGFIFFIKCLSALIQKNKLKTYNFVFGLMLASFPVLILINLSIFSTSLYWYSIFEISLAILFSFMFHYLSKKYLI